MFSILLERIAKRQKNTEVDKNEKKFKTIRVNKQDLFTKRKDIQITERVQKIKPFTR